MAKSLKKSKKSKKAKKSSLKRKLLKFSLIISIWGVIFLTGALIYFASDLPDVDKLYEDYRRPNIKILDKNGELINNIGDNFGDYVSFHQLPEHLVNAVLSTEDRKFFSHFGFDPLGIIRAMIKNYKEGRVVQGGSTITQQLAKVVFLSHERKLKRKIQELMLALYIERNFTKEQIFAMYINRIYFGSGNWGVSAATKAYFDKNVEDITLFESAILAGMIKAPSRYSPINNYQLAQNRADQVLKLMIDNEVITADDIINGGTNQNFKIPTYAAGAEVGYYTDWINEQIPNLVNKDEFEESDKSDIIVYTTLDKNLQKKASQILKEKINKLDKGKNANQGAIVTMSSTGEVLAMVGGVDYEKSQFNRAYQAKRQPGSVAKIFVYLSAFEDGKTPQTTMIDEPITINKWSPKNWNNKYIGEVSLKDAYAKSINTIAVKLTDEMGIDRVLRSSRKLGIQSDIGNNLSLALGTSEADLIELTGAYAKIGNGGFNIEPYGITKITNVTGDVIYQRKSHNKVRIIKEEVVGYMNEIMKAVISYGTGSRARIKVDSGGKTGTSQGSKDAWFIGYTSDITTGVWVGNDDNSNMKKVGGGNLPAQIWQDYMSYAVKDMPNKPLPVTSYKIQQEQKKNNIWRSIVDKLIGSD